MRRVGQARKRDATEGPIVDALRKCGAFVVRISGEDAPDLLVRFGGKWTPLEVKSRGGKLTEGQKRAEYPVARTIDEAFVIIGIQSR